MAAYAALVSLMNTKGQILSHPRYSTSLDKKQIESLGESVGFLLYFIESYNYCHGDSKETEDLESQIARAAHAAEDIIESRVVNPIFAESSKKGITSFLDLQKIIEDLESIKEKVMKVKKGRGFKGQEPTYSMPAASSRHLTTEKNALVGFDGYLTQLLERLTGQQSNRQVIPVVGMGGIGKTTLARNIYEHLVVVEHFHLRAWVTISQEYNVKGILLEVFSCLRESTRGMDEKTEDQLGEQLYKTLSGMRYLIILDDMWSIEVWNKIKFFFPDNYNRSRIIVTTRLSDVANHLGSFRLAVDFLSDNESWNLFCEKAFAQEGCPSELEKIGKKIVKRCKGLPLAIVVIGGLLGKLSSTQEYWENVSRDVSSILNSGEDNQCFSILYLSYRHLPACLKPCFLYLGIFPEDYEIRASRLIKLWVAEGFIKPNEHQSLEEIAEGYIKDLVDRNLISIRRLGLNGRYKTYNTHDLLRDLCLRVVEKEKFLCVISLLNRPRGIDRQHRIIIRGRTPEEEEYSLDAIFQQVNLRFLALESFSLPMRNYTYKLPSSISLLWNVQTLIIKGRRRVCEVVAPSAIWEMPQLRHLKFDLLNLPDPPSSHKKSDFVLRNLQTLRRVSNFRWSEEVCKRIPNIRQLHICYTDFSREGDRGSRYCLYNVGRLNKLKSLSYSFYNLKIQDNLRSNLTFPSSLRKLYLRECKLGWEDLTIVGSLPHLEVLKLDMLSVVGSEWNPSQGEFLRLKFLKIFGCIDLIHWNADRSHFPVLESLELCQLHRLDEIPSGIGEIPTLQGICLHDCNIFAAISAVKILEEQENLGNQGLQVQVKFWKKDKLEEFREKLELEGLATQNFQLRQCSY